MLLEFASHIAKNNLDIPHTHNPFNERYAEYEGQGLDSEIETKKGKIGEECKNNGGGYWLSSFWCDREITARFNGLECFIKLVIVALLNIGHKTLKKLRALGYHFIEVGFQIKDFEQFKKAINILTRKLYWIKKRFFPSKPKPIRLKQKTLLDIVLPMSNMFRESYRYLDKYLNQDQDKQVNKLIQ